MTEDEAKKKWCPFARMIEGPTEPHNWNRPSGNSTPNNANCIGSQCMMWRATDNEFPLSNATNVHHSLNEGLPSGYCGLAGKS